MLRMLSLGRREFYSVRHIEKSAPAMQRKEREPKHSSTKFPSRKRSPELSGDRIARAPLPSRSNEVERTSKSIEKRKYDRDEAKTKKEEAKSDQGIGALCCHFIQIP